MPQRWGRTKGETQGRRLAEGRARQGLCRDVRPPNRECGNGRRKGGGWQRGTPMGGGHERYTNKCCLCVIWFYFYHILHCYCSSYSEKQNETQKKKRRNRSLKLSSGETVRVARTVRSVHLGKDCRRISILGTVERKLISGSFELVYMYAEVSACNKEMYYQLRRDSSVVINGPCYRLPRSTLDTSTLRVSCLIGWLCPAVLHPEYTHRGIEHLGQTHNHHILLVCDIVRHVPLTLMHSTHPALQSEHQGPIRESACSTTSPPSWPCRKQLLTK